MDKGGEQWLKDLRKMEYKDTHSALTSLTGVGAKVFLDYISFM